MNESEWREQLKAGDEVFVRRRGITDITTVEKTTKTQVTVNGLRYSRGTGWQIGASNIYGSSVLKRPTEETREQVLTEQEIRKLTGQARKLQDRLKIPTDKEGLERFIATLGPLVESQKKETP